MKTVKRFDTRRFVLLALLTAIVAVLTALAAIFPIRPFTLTLALVPMVIGAALTGTLAGGWLGFVFGLLVLLTGNADLFLAINPFGTILVVLLKGAFAGLAAGVFYKIFSKKSVTAGTIAAAIICPIVNTGIFILGLYAFFMPAVTAMAEGEGQTNIFKFILVGIVGINFFIELAINIVLCPTIIRLIQYWQNRKTLS